MVLLVGVSLAVALRGLAADGGGGGGTGWRGLAGRSLPALGMVNHTLEETATRTHPRDDFDAETKKER